MNSDAMGEVVLASEAFQGTFAALTTLGCEPLMRRNGSISSLCPVHERDGQKHTPALSTFIGRQGRLISHCHAGCAWQAIRELLRRAGAGESMPGTVRPAGMHGPEGAISARLTQRWDESTPVGGDWPPARQTWPVGAVRSKHVATYRYTSACGAWLLGLVDRYHFLDAGGDRVGKTFRQRVPISHYHARARRLTIAWRSPAGLPLPLFGWPALYDRGEATPIYIVEGEQDCLALWQRGLHAVTAPRGSKGWTAAHTAALRQALLPEDMVRLAPDVDRAGVDWRRTLTQALRGAGVVVEVA